MLRQFACLSVLVALIPFSASQAQVTYTITEDFEDPGWFDGETWTKEGADHPEVHVLQFSDADPFLNGASIGSASGGLRASLTDYGFYTGGDHGEVYLDLHIHVPPGDYTFEVALDQLVYWEEWLTKNPGQLWGCGQYLYLGDAADLEYGSQEWNQPPLGPWVAPGFPGAEQSYFTLLGNIWQGSPDNINGIWVHNSYTEMNDGTTVITTTGDVIFRMVMRNKWNVSENMAFAMDNLEVKLTRLGDCPYPIVFDANEDGDVDSADFGVFQRCWTGLAQQITTDQCRCLDLDGDNHVAEPELAGFLICSSGPSVAADPACDD